MRRKAEEIITVGRGRIRTKCAHLSVVHSRVAATCWAGDLVWRIHPIPVNGCIPQSKRLQTSFQLSSVRVMCPIALCFVFITWSALVFSPNSPCPPNDRWSACCLSICGELSEECSQGNITCPGAFVFISSPQQDRGSDSHGGGAYLWMDRIPRAMGCPCNPSFLGTERGKISSTQKLESRLCKKKEGKEKKLTLHFASGSKIHWIFFFQNSTELKAKGFQQTNKQKKWCWKKMELNGSFKVNQQNLASHDGHVSRKEG